MVPSTTVTAGTVVGGRFTVESFAAQGGMAKVYRARDDQSGETVALKLATSLEAEFRDRFLRETRVLAQLRHPNVVRYIDSGVDQGVPYLAMEWLEGETLSHRLARGPLTADEAMLTMRAMCEGVAHAHARGLVHRDLKPSNILLLKDALDGAVVLDFGLARQLSGRSALTQTDVLVGTVGYMSPEQLRDPDSADARSDVFALGCILHQCLTGKRAYPERDIAVLIGRILFDPPPRVDSVAPHVPAKLAELALRCLSKEPAERPADGAALLVALASASGPKAPSAAPSAPHMITDRERRRGSLILLASTPPGSTGGGEHTTSMGICPPEVMTAVLAPYAARALLLAEDLAVVLLRGEGAAVDQAAQAVRCALALAETAPHARCTVVSGQAEAEGAPVLGELFARALALDSGAPGGGIRVDDLTANLIGERFQQRIDDGVRVIVAERTHDEPSRRVLGRSTPFVGRERELLQLEGVIAEAHAEPGIRTALVLGDAGMGKTRLRAELIRRLHPGVHSFSASGDARTKRSPFALARELVRQGLGLRTGERELKSRARIDRRLRRLLTPDAAAALAPFLGELAGVAASDSAVELRLARGSPGELADRLRAAFQQWVLAEAHVAPLLIVLEDAHWADAVSLDLIDRLRSDADVPIAIIAFARPTLHTEHPEALRRPTVSLDLAPLSAKASERVIRAILPNADADTVRDISRQALGNAFFLEELVRSHADGRNAHPETVVMALQARVEDLDPSLRRFLRAASVIGEVFWLEGVAELTGTNAAELEKSVRALEVAELVTSEDTSRYSGARELRFRHALVRDAAYAMLPEGDRQLAHRLLAGWLFVVGEGDSRVIAEQWEAGGDRVTAARHYERAAEQALAAHALDLALDMATRASVDGDRSAVAALVAAEVLSARDTAAAQERARRAISLLTPGVPHWYRANFFLISTSLRRGEIEVTRRAIADVLAAPLADDDIDARMSLADTAQSITALHDGPLMNALLERARRPAGFPADPLLDALREVAQSLSSSIGTVGVALAQFRRIAELYDGVGHTRRALGPSANLGYLLNIAGSFAEAEPLLRRVSERAAELGLADLSAAAESNLAVSVTNLGRAEAGVLHAERARARFRDNDARLFGSSSIYAARAYLALGRVDEARTCIDEALVATKTLPPSRALALGTRAAIELSLGHVDTAVAAADEGLRFVEAHSGIYDDAALRETYVAALRAKGDLDAARNEAERTFSVLRARSMSLDAALRPAFAMAPLHRAVALHVTELTGQVPTYP